MKCAFELQLIAEVKAAEIAREKAEREERERLAREARTLKFCEELGEKLEKQAYSGECPRTSFMLVRYKKDEYVLANPTHDDYADRRLSYKFSFVNTIDLNTLTEWFKEYCFRVECKQESIYSYGWGECNGYCINILPEPKC
jgi:hypothetical protein